MFSDGLFDLLDESAPSLPAPACSTNTIIYEEENEDLQGQPLSLASTTSPLIKKGLFNVQVLVTDFTGTWTELETVYLLAKDTNPTVAYQKVAPRANLTTNTTSTDKNIVHAQILRKTQPLGDNSPFREPHEPVLVRIQRWGKNGANRLSYWENDAIRRMQPPPLDMLQDDSYVYAVFPAGPLLHSSPSTEGLLHHDRPTNTAENDTNKNSLEYHRPDNTTDDSHDGNQIEPSQYDVSVGSDKNNKPIPDCQVQLTRGLPDDPEMEQVQTNHRQIDGPELNCKRKDQNLQNKVEKQEDTAEFLVRNKEQSMEWINNAYSAKPAQSQTFEGHFVTSLCEDVYCIVQVYIRTLQEHFMNHPEDLVQAVGDILEHLYTAQIQFRDTFLTDWEACCAAANDFLRMGELLENILTKHLLLWSQDDNNNTQTAALEQKTAMLLGLYSRDAVFAAQTIHSFIMTTIEEAISEDLFGKAWLHDFTENQFAWTIVRTVEDYFEDLQLCLDGTLLEKAFESLVQSSVILYSKCLVAMSSKQLNIKKSVWKDNTEALDRIAGDISVIKHFFESLATESPIYPTLARTIEDQFGLLEILHEVLSITAGISSAALQDFVPLLHRRFKNLDLTKRVVGDLIHVVHPPSEKKAYKIVDSILNELGALVANDDTWHGLLGGRDLVSGLCLEDELTRICIENDKTRIRPGLKTANMSGKDPTEVMLHMWSKRSIHYRKKATKSIKKNLSVAGTSARVSVAKSFSKISFSDTTKSVPKKVSTGSNSNLTRDQQNAKEAQQSIAARIAMYKAKY